MWSTWASPTVYVALAVPFLLVLANENVFVVYGTWLETQFGLTVTALGIASLVISVAELIGEGAAAGLVDRLGKRRAVLGGLLLSVLSYLLLPRLAGVLGTALVGVFLMFLTFEFSIVGLLPLVSELAPEARGAVLALNVAVMSLGRLISSLLAPRLWAAGGLPLNALVSAGAVLVAALILWRGVRERPRGPHFPAR
jgi:predicted MFS family arabinose efflux permease